MQQVPRDFFWTLLCTLETSVVAVDSGRVWSLTQNQEETKAQRHRPSIFHSTRVFANASALLIKWPKYWNYSFSPSSEYSGLTSFRTACFDLLAVQGTLKSLLLSWGCIFPTTHSSPGMGLSCLFLQSFSSWLVTLLTQSLFPAPLFLTCLHYGCQKFKNSLSQFSSS